LLTGDLSLLHDTNGFLILPQWQGHLTIVLINNSGGGIFGMLPIAAFEPPFETFFATPQSVNFTQLCATYGVAHTLVESWEHLAALLNPLPTQGVRVLEVVCDRAQDAQWRQVQLKRLSHLPIF
jgi:2-succinyl-5-enolpyruvyl-6-hydroxy-3-cyclohexene-1-carboxylate synthase